MLGILLRFGHLNPELLANLAVGHAKEQALSKNTLEENEQGLLTGGRHFLTACWA